MASDANLLTAIIGGVIGGFLGVIGTIVSSYYGPRKMEEWREKKKEEKLNGPRKKFLKSLLENPQFSNGRTIETLSQVTGTDKTECRRLLIEIGARGIHLKERKKEGWTFKPITEE